MTHYKLNPTGNTKAASLIQSHHYVIESDWSESQPTSEAENEYLQSHGWEEYSKWFLAIDPAGGEQTKGRLHFPFGDFRRLHRSGLIAAKQRAAQNGHQEIETAADELLQKFGKQRAK